MSYFGVGLRNAVSIGLGGIATLFGGRSQEQAESDLLCENGDYLVQENGSFILV
jgi:hypothetical protein